MAMTSRRPPAWVAAGGAAILAATFALDLLLPPGVAVSIAYVAAVLLGLWAPRSAHAIVTAAIATILVTIGILLDHGALSDAVVTLNQLFALLGIWSAALVTWWHGQIEAVATSSRRELSAYQHALDQSSIVAITDARGIIRYANDKFCEISRYSREELIGQDHRILNSRFHPKEFFKDLWSTIRQGRVWRGEIRNRAKDGTMYWVDTVIVPFLDDEGKPVSYVAIRSDITERKKAQEALLRQESLARLGAMAAVVAHEVRNPLAGIGGALQIIGSRMSPEAPEKPIIAEMLGRIDALDVMITDLLQFARPRAPRLTPVSLAAMTRETADLLLSDPAMRELRVEIEGPADGEAVLADAEMIRQVLTNLLLNAGQSMQGRGVVRVVLGETPGSRTVVVADEGPGVPAEDAERIFEPFFTTKSRGTGLGLPLARRHATAHGGTLELLHSERGARFALTLPCRPLPPEPAKSSAGVAEHSPPDAA